MAHYAELDKENNVVRVIVINNADCISDEAKTTYNITKEDVRSISGDKLTKDEAQVEWEDEAKGIAVCKNLLGGDWVRTSYNGNVRKQYAGEGYTYDKENDVFISPQPYPSWSLNKVFDWEAPSAKPDDGEYSWDEKAGEWVALIEDVLSIA